LFPPRLAGALAFSAMLALAGCRFGGRHGYLNVSGLPGGLYEIYRVDSESPMQLVSEHVGTFNEDVKLPAGRYLVLADCSSQPVRVYAGQREKLVAHQINFIPAMAPGEDDKFSIQCERAEKTRSRQYFSNRFSLSMIGESHDILVGMVPLSLQFGGTSGDINVKSHLLSAIKVESTPETPPDLSYFVSPTTDLVSVTEKQDFGKWLFLLPGDYEVEVNGTKMLVSLAEGEKRVITPAFIKVETSPRIDLELSSQIRGTPLFVEVNDGHWFNLNERYAVLPGKTMLRLSGSNQPKAVELEEGEKLDLPARSVIVDQGCSPWEWNCLGDLEVRLYQPAQPFPFATGVTDVPLLFFESEVLVGVEGSRNVRYRIPKGTRDMEAHIGYLEIVPKPVHVKGQITDLLRVEAQDASLTGVTLDIALDRPTRMPLVTGQYQIAHYVMSTSVDGDRRRSSQVLKIGRDQTVTMPVQVYLSEKKMASLRKPLASNGSKPTTSTASRDMPEGRSHEIERQEKAAGNPRVTAF
jgi:hypothetical protein